MPRLDENQERQLRERLEAERAELLRDIEEELRSLGLDPAEARSRDVEDAADASVTDLLVHLDAERAQRHTLALEAVDRALQALGTDRYGVCERCGVDIPFARLLAQPTATRCIRCQTLYEQGEPPPSNL